MRRARTPSATELLLACATFETIFIRYASSVGSLGVGFSSFFSIFFGAGGSFAARVGRGGGGGAFAGGGVFASAGAPRQTTTPASAKRVAQERRKVRGRLLIARRKKVFATKPARATGCR